MLTDAANQGQIVVNDDLLFEAVRNALCRTYPLQDALHGASDGLPDALAGFLAMVEEARRVKAEDIPEDVQQAGAVIGSVAQEQDDPRGTPYFAPTGWQAHYFVVKDGITEESALDGDSMFLALASNIGHNADEVGDRSFRRSGGRACRHRGQLQAETPKGVAAAGTLHRPGRAPGFSLSGLIRIAKICLPGAYRKARKQKAQ